LCLCSGSVGALSSTNQMTIQLESISLRVHAFRLAKAHYQILDGDWVQP
jgi:hypothetical protein